MRKIHIYVAGHTGLVGSAVLRQLGMMGYRNYLLRNRSELDLRDKQAVDDFFSEHQPRIVILAAARPGTDAEHEKNPAGLLYDNMQIGFNVIDAARRHGTEKLIHVASASLYPSYVSQPLREEALMTGYLDETREPTALAGLATLKFCEAVRKEYGLNFFTVLAPNLYGPEDRFDLETGHVFAAMIRKFYLARCLQDKNHEAIRRDLPSATTGELGSEKYLEQQGISVDRVRFRGTGSPTREFLHVYDLARAIVQMTASDWTQKLGPVVNVGTGRGTSIRELADLIRGVSGFEGEVDWDHRHPDGTLRRVLDCSRINAWGWSPRITLQRGIEEVYLDYAEGR